MQIIKIRNENGDIITDSTEIKRVEREYREQLHVNKSDNLHEMEKFLRTQNLLRLNHEATKSE